MAPQLEKVFSQFGMDREDVRFQVKSMFFNNDFPNIYAGDQVRIFPRVILEKNGLYFRFEEIEYQGMVQVTIPLLNSSLKYQQMTGPELAERMNIQVDDFIFSRIGNLGNGAIYLLSRILAAINFEIDSMSGKLSVVLEQAQFTGNAVTPVNLLQVVQNPDGSYTDGVYILQTLDGMRIVEFGLVMTTDAAQSTISQKRVAQALGLPEMEDLTFPARYGYYFYDAANEARLVYEGSQHDNAPLQMDLNWIKYIAVRTSTRTNIMYEDGHSERVIDYIPVQTGALGALETYEKDEKLYAISETLQGVRKVDIDLLDHNNEPIVFLSDYVLQLVIFFK